MIHIYEYGEKEKIRKGITKLPLKIIYLDDVDQETREAKQRLALAITNEEFKKIKSN